MQCVHVLLSLLGTRIAQFNLEDYPTILICIMLNAFASLLCSKLFLLQCKISTVLQSRYSISLQFAAVNCICLHL